MFMDNRELKVRLDIARKKEFFTHILIYSVVSLLTLLIWVGMGFGVFWPIWVFATFSITLFLEAVHVGSLPFLKQYFCFLEPGWEEKEACRILESEAKTEPKKATK